MYLLAAVALAFLFVQLTNGVLNTGLGWAHKPGPMIILLLMAFGLYAVIHNISNALSALTLLLFFISMFLEYLPIDRTIWALSGIVLSIMGSFFVFRKTDCKYFWKFGLLLVSAYIQSVFLYNLFHGNQLMTFFRGGWTA